MNRAEIIHKRFLEKLADKNLPTLPEEAYSNLTSCALKDSEICDLFETQMMSRLLDITSRRLASRKQSFYTIGSSGHEGNAVFGRIFRDNDPAFLHYRSCAFAIQRSKQLAGQTPLYDSLLAFAASSEDPISGGRHKVIGSKALWIPPQTSTIASHLPKAMGAAYALGLYKNVDHNDVGLADDGIVICSFGDASANHSTALGAINTAAWTAFQLSPMPVIFICEDNGIGISTRTPTNWIKANFEHKPGIKYISCNGLDILSTVDAAMKADHHARVLRKPVFLHMKTVRLMGHAGSDVEQSYQTKQQITQNESQDPLLYSAALITEKDILTHNEIRSWYLHTEERIRRIAEEAIARPKLTSTSEVLQSLWPTSTSNGQLTSKRSAKSKTLKEANTDKALPMAKHINTALADIMAEHPNTVILGEDVGQKGGVYGVTQGLHEQFGPSRITNTVLDEQSILGAAIGLAQCGYLPIAEIQYLAYVHNAEDQIRGEAASLSFFSEAQFTNPMVVRIAGFAYQKGFGGHFHNDNSFAVFRDIPGIIVVTPSNGPDAASILRSCIAMAIEEHKVLIIIEPIALYSTRDLHKDGDGLWAAEYKRARDQNTIRWGDIKTIGNGKDLCILSYANGFYLSNKAEKILREQHNLRVRLVDIRWLHPLPEKQISDVTADYEHILIVDECRRSGSVSEALFTLFAESGRHCKIARVNAEDSFVPLGQAANLVLPSVDEIVDNALQLINSHTGTSVLDLRKNSND